MIEPLESRVMLTTLTGSGTLEYKAADDTLVRVSWGNVRAELIFASIDDETLDVELRDHVPAFDEETPGADLFSIYVASSNRNSYISIAAVPGLDESPRPMLPFEGSIGELKIENASDGTITDVSVSDGTGAVLLGARTKGEDNAENNPIDTLNLNGAFGVRPDLPGPLKAGLHVADGNDFGRFLFGGTVFGEVNIGGSIETFYCGTLLTGTSFGEILGDPNNPNNFFVDGDINNLIVLDSIGTVDSDGGGAPVYYTGFDLRVRGSVDQIVSNLDSFYGSADIDHRLDGNPFGSSQREVEDRTFVTGSDTRFENGDLGDLGNHQNDTPETAQFLGTLENNSNERVVRMDGTIEANPLSVDMVDYYAISLMAGQEVTFTLDNPGSLIMGIFDPDGRLIISNINSNDAIEPSFRFTADVPGTYRVAVAAPGNSEFTSAGTLIGDTEYTLRMSKVGDLGLGGLVVAGDVFNQTNYASLNTRNGDIGSVEVGGILFYAGPQDQDDIRSNKGNIRVLDAGQIGLSINDDGFGPNIDAPRGSIGLIRSGALANIETVVIGGDLQVVDSAGTLFIELTANGSLGTIRAADMASLNPSILSVNVDGEGKPGTIDLIDVSGDLGTFESGGPEISTGPGGNVRYINVDGQVYRDAFFGGGFPDDTDFDPAEKVDLTDDSGAAIRLTPIPLDPDTTPDITNPVPGGNFIDPGELTVVTYPIRDKGGVVVVNVTSTRGLQIDVNGKTAEFGKLEIEGSGTRLVRNLLTGNLALANNGDELDVILRGSGVVDVLNIEGGNFTRIRNSSAGEIVNIEAVSIGDLRARTLGLAKRNTDASVYTIDSRATTYPFNDQRLGVFVRDGIEDDPETINGIILAAAERGLGNFFVDGTIQRLIANSDGENVGNVFEGITGPIQVTEDLTRVDIGEGILPSGSGELSRAGLYAEGEITLVTGSNADIRGDVISLESIQEISLFNGSIIGADILAVTTFESGSEVGPGLSSTDTLPDSFNNPIFEIQEVNISGNGGIIGVTFTAADIGYVTVGDDGFGIFNSNFIAPGDGRVESVVAGGYGVRDVFVQAGASMGQIVATGNGTRASTAGFQGSVRLSETKKYDPYFHFAPDNSTDIHLFLGTSADEPRKKNVTRTGVIENADLRGSRNLEVASAERILRSDFRFGNAVESIDTKSVTKQLSITSGRMRSYLTRGDTISLDMNIAGPINSFDVRGDLDAGSAIDATGPNGVIESMNVRKGLFGDVRASTSAGVINVGGKFGGNLRIDGDFRDNVALQSLKIGSDFIGGSINAKGKINLIEVGRDFGKRGETVRINGVLNKLSVGRNLFSDIRVRQDIGTLDVGRSILSNSVITVDRDLDALIIGRDLEAGAVINVGRNLGTKNIGGDELGDVVEG